MSTERTAAVDNRFRALLDDYGLPSPDVIEHTSDQVRFVWSDRKVAVVIDLADLEPGHRLLPAEETSEIVS